MMPLYLRIVFVAYMAVCSYGQAAQVRLVNGHSSNEGRVEVLYKGVWGTVCDDTWNLLDAVVVCRMLGYPGANQFYRSAHFGAGSGRIWLDDVICIGTETSINQCRHNGWGVHNCNHNEDAGVECLSPSTSPPNTAAQVRLVNGHSSNEGRVEVLYKGVWGTVCDDTWNLLDAVVVCRMLGYPGANQFYRSAHFGAGSGRIWLDDVICIGTETSINQCRHNGWGVHNCNHNEDAGVECLSPSTSPPNTGATGFVLYTDAGAGNIYRLNILGATSVSSPQLIIHSRNPPFAVTYDPLEGRIYWSDTLTRKISRAYLNGSTEEVVMPNVRKAVGLAVDVAGRNLYWADSMKRRIEVCRLDGSHRKILLRPGKLKDLVLDVTRGLVYWTSADYPFKIERASMDGSNRAEIISSSIHNVPIGLAIDAYRNILYWTEQYIDRIFYVNLTNPGLQKEILTSSSIPQWLAILGGRIYWTSNDWQGAVYSANRMGNSDVRKLVNLHKPQGIYAYNNNSSSHAVSYGCRNQNGGCSHLCLLTPEGHKCACSGGMALKDDGKTCYYKEFIIVVDHNRGRIYKKSLDDLSHVKESVPLKDLQSPYAVDFDPLEGRIYWTDTHYGRISRAFLNGSSQEVIVNQGVSHTYGLIVDSVGRNLYWTDSQHYTIEVSKLDGSDQKKLISLNGDVPKAIVLDSRNGLMYYCSSGITTNIKRAEMSGDNIQSISNLQNSRFLPTGLALDRENKRLYWIAHLRNKIFYIETDQVNGQIYTVLTAYHYLYSATALALKEDFLYWADLNDVYRVNKTSPSFGRVQAVVSGINSPTDIHVYHNNTDVQDDYHPCATNNGWCTHLCLLKPGGYKCACPTKQTPGRNCQTTPQIPSPSPPSSSPLPHSSLFTFAPSLSKSSFPSPLSSSSPLPSQSLSPSSSSPPSPSPFSSLSPSPSPSPSLSPSPSSLLPPSQSPSPYPSSPLLSPSPSPISSPSPSPSQPPPPSPSPSPSTFPTPSPSQSPSPSPSSSSSPLSSPSPSPSPSPSTSPSPPPSSTPSPSPSPSSASSSLYSPSPSSSPSPSPSPSSSPSSTPSPSPSPSSASSSLYSPSPSSSPSPSPSPSQSPSPSSASSSLYSPSPSSSPSPSPSPSSSPSSTPSPSPSPSSASSSLYSPSPSSSPSPSPSPSQSPSPSSASSSPLPSPFSSTSSSPALSQSPSPSPSPSSIPSPSPSSSSSSSPSTLPSPSSSSSSSPPPLPSPSPSPLSSSPSTSPPPLSQALSPSTSQYPSSSSFLPSPSLSTSAFTSPFSSPSTLITAPISSTIYTPTTPRHHSSTPRHTSSNTPFPNGCSRTTCFNGATCRTSNESPWFRCFCSTGFASEHCQTNVGENIVTVTFNVALDQWSNSTFKLSISRAFTEHCKDGNDKNCAFLKSKHREMRSESEIQFHSDDVLVITQPKAFQTGEVQVSVAVVNPTTRESPIAKNDLCKMIHNTRQRIAYYMDGHRILKINGQEKPKCVERGGGKKGQKMDESSEVTVPLAVTLSLLFFAVIFLAVYFQRLRKWCYGVPIIIRTRQTRSSFNNRGYLEEDNDDDNDNVYEPIRDSFGNPIYDVGTNFSIIKPPSSVDNPIYNEVGVDFRPHLAVSLPDKVLPGYQAERERFSSIGDEQSVEPVYAKPLTVIDRKDQTQSCAPSPEKLPEEQLPDNECASVDNVRPWLPNAEVKPSLPGMRNGQRRPRRTDAQGIRHVPKSRDDETDYYNINSGELQRPQQTRSVCNNGTSQSVDRSDSCIPADRRESDQRVPYDGRGHVKGNMTHPEHNGCEPITTDCNDVKLERDVGAEYSNLGQGATSSDPSRQPHHKSQKKKHRSKISVEGDSTTSANGKKNNDKSKVMFPDYSLSSKTPDFDASSNSVPRYATLGVTTRSDSVTGSEYAHLHHDTRQGSRNSSKDSPSKTEPNDPRETDETQYSRLDTLNVTPPRNIRTAHDYYSLDPRTRISISDVADDVVGGHSSSSTRTFPESSESGYGYNHLQRGEWAAPPQNRPVLILEAASEKEETVI